MLARVTLFGRQSLLAAGGIAAFVMTISGAAQAQSAPRCLPSNVPCQCSYSCCDQESCEGAICNQCVLDCVQRKKPTDARFTALQSRCRSQTTQKYKRL